VVAQIAVLALTARRVARLTTRNIGAQVELNEYVVQALAGIATVKATGAEGHVISVLSRQIAEWTRTTLQQMHFTAMLESFSTTIRLATPLIVLWLGAARVLDAEISLGSVLALTWLASAIAGSLTGLVANAARLQIVRVELGRVGEVTAAPVERQKGSPLPRPLSGGSRLELRDVSFSYEPGARPAVEGVSLTIEPGQRVAIVGATGAGKTTLAWLLLALYHPTGGEIRYDGVPLSELDLHQLRGRFGVVLQDSFMIGGSIRDNIAFSRPDATADDVVEAASLAEMHEEISRMPAGYDSLIGERGVGLSGGQLQRLAIARALVGRPSVLLLDEATSHLDSRTEARIVANLRRVRCTQVVIAHRLSTVYDADQIVVVDCGKVVERGVHADLVARGGSYTALIAAQLPSPV
jgi:ABC-type bacteriocin/lantibiotic exporter with double-glycine peptidase domain